MSPEPDSYFILTVVLAVLCLVLSFFYAAGESAVDFLSQAQVKKDADEGNPSARRLVKLVNWQKAAVSPLQAGLALFGLLGLGSSIFAFVWLAENAFSPVQGDRLRFFLAVLIITVVYLLVFFLFGNLLPKKSARHNAKEFAYRYSTLLCALQALAFPFLKLCALIVNGILRLCGIDPHILDDPVTEEEILQMVGEGEEKGVIEETELDMITNILDFKDTTAEETMTHRTDIIAVEDTAPIEEVVEASVENGCSRIPVYHEDIDTILGVIFVKDLLKYVGKEFSSEVKLTDLLRPAYFVPESKLCSQLFQEMTSQHFQFAVIVDEYGGTEGIVTLEDILESIVGNIQDEYDNEEEEIYKVSDNAYTVDGSTNIDEVSDLVGVDLPEGDYDTIAGLVVEHLGRIPKEGEHPAVTIENLTLTVEKVEDRRIAKILIVKEVPPAEPEDEEPDKEKEKEKGRKKEKNA